MTYAVKAARGFGTSRLRSFIVAGALLLALGASFVFSRYTAYQQVQQKFYGQALVPDSQAYDFKLVDQEGHSFRLDQLRGKLVLFSFGFTHCPNVCPTTLSDLGKVYRSLPERERAKVQVVFISVDPQRDKPELLKNYVPYFDKSFIGLTGSPEQIAQTAKAYGAYYEKVHTPGEDPDVYFMDHSAFIYLISPDSRWKLIYNFDQLHQTQKMVGDIERILG
ncbi:MAG: SCO family protein [Verrucomicrobia bacterium]|nr:SCO family protein [Verrucomicrobiota bacterium]